MTPPAIAPSQVCAVVLAGGRGERMGGTDKGLQPYLGIPLAQHALQRLQRQAGGAPGRIIVNANRNQDTYRQWGVEVCADGIQGYEGPLAGVLTALQMCDANHPYLLTVPCDSPLFPLNLLERLATALQTQGADIAMALAPEQDDAGQFTLRKQPVFCLYKSHLAPSLRAFMDSGRRKIDAWTGQHSVVEVPFNLPGDDRRAFSNANTLAELQALEHP